MHSISFLSIILIAGTTLLSQAIAGTAVIHSSAPNTLAVPTINIEASKVFTTLPYRHHLEIQRQLHGYLPPGPELIDLWFRVGYPGKSEAERDAVAPREQVIAVESATVNAPVPMRRGAYFSLPAIQAAYDENAEIQINEASRPWLGIWWTLRVPENQRMAYADIRAARVQLQQVQDKISAFESALKGVKRERYDGIKACFHAAGGAILINGRAVADATEGHCTVLFEDAARAPDDKVEFSGPLDVVSFIDRRYYTRRQ